jgi:beta-lactamase superfamily II metal-dependent hydrolase
MPSDIRYAAYPSAKVYDAKGHEVQHVLWGDWVQVTGPRQQGKLPVHVRGQDGFMVEAELQVERLLEIVFIDVGQGDGCLIVTPDDKKLVVDAGEADNLYRFLNWRFRFLGGVRRFDAAFITHPDMDHYRGFARLFKEPNVPGSSRSRMSSSSGSITTASWSRPENRSVRNRPSGGSSTSPN